MRRSAFPAFTLQLLLFGCVLLMISWVRVPWFSVATVGISGLIVCGTSVAGLRGKQTGRTGPLVVVWICTLLAPFSLVLSSEKGGLDFYFVEVAWLMAATIFVTSFFIADAEFRRRWRGIAVIWGLFGSLDWLSFGYSQNAPAAFYAGLGFSVAFLIAGKCVFRMPTTAVLFVNTLILLAFILPVGDLVLRPSYRLEANPEVARKFYSYSAARKNPAAFARWWKYYGEQTRLLAKKLYIPDPSGFLPFRLRPGAQHVLFQSHISINSKGFRGKEIADDKGAAYRIVALGESTTFGLTLREEDRPWPEVLEQIIRERLRPTRRVEVINAGVPGWTLAHNLHRLSADILSLKPDMIISYHGINSFPLLDGSIPPPSGPPPPKYRERPLKILADAEHSLKVRLYRQRLATIAQPHAALVPNPMQSRYAQGYRDLIEAARTNDVTLVLSTFSMAVNAHSDADVVEFYRSGFPAVHAQIRANMTHSLIVQKLAAEHPEVCLVDTQPKLDGEYEKFIDLMHFTQPGREQLAETFFAGIQKVLESDLGRADESATTGESGNSVKSR